MGKDNVSIRLETRQVCSLSHLPFNTALGVLAHAIKPEKKIKAIQIDQFGIADGHYLFGFLKKKSYCLKPWMEM